jgi:hypothetical protein
MSMILDGSNGVTFNDASLQGAAASPYVLKNRIINGDMRIDQRNNGASVGTASGTGAYTVDRWQITYDQTNKFTAQQNAGSVTPPAGYINYLGITSSSAYTVGSSEQFLVRQFIEGFNTADLAWGTANARTVTLSFWVRSSLTGTFGGVIGGYVNTNSYPFTYTISSANTWEQKTITITGDTSGTWNTGNSGGIGIIFGLGVGSTLSGTAGSWSASRFWSATGATSVVGTNGATWYVTGVQLEQNTSATPFERRLYNQELANCQRYGYALCNSTISVGSESVAMGQCFSTTSARVNAQLPVTMRAVPTATVPTQTNFRVYNATNSGIPNVTALSFASGASSQNSVVFDATVSSGLVAGNATALVASNSTPTTGTIFLSAEL